MPDESISSGDDFAEVWAYRSLVGAAFAITFSIALGEILSGLCLLLALIALVRRRLTPFLPHIFVLALAFFCVAAIASCQGVNPEHSLRSLRKLVWFLMIPAAACLVTKADRLGTLLRGFAMGCGVLGLYICLRNPIAAFRTLGERNAPDSYLVALIQEGSMTDGQMLMLGIAVALGLALVPRKPGCGRFWWFVLALQSIALIVNFKRGSWFCAAGLVAILVGRRVGLRWLLLLVLVALVPLAVPGVRSRLAGLRDELSVEKGGRLTMWVRVTPELVRKHPWGIGYRALTNRMMRRVDRRVERHRDHLHSNVAQVAVDTGWIGLLIYLCWMSSALVDAICFCRQSNRMGGREAGYAFLLLLLLIGLLANGLVEYNFGDAEIVIVYSVIMGCCAAGCRRLSNPVRAAPD